MKCEHCKIDFEEKSMIFIESEGIKKAFCCEGCFGVYNIIYKENLDEFYLKIKKKSLSPVKNNTNINADIFEKFITKDENGFSKTSFIIKNIHCSACVWLIEKILTKTQGILEVQMSHHTYKIDVCFDDSIITIKDILEKIISLGYIPSAYNPLYSQNSKENKREFYLKLILAIVCVMNIMWLSVAKYAGMFDGMDGQTQDIINYAEFIFASATLFYTGYEFFKSAFYSLKNGYLNMDFLVILGALLVYIYSIFAMFLRLENVYFDSVCMIICFVFIGKYLEILSRKKMLDNIDFLQDLIDDRVCVKLDNKYEFKNISSVKIGDIIKLEMDDKCLIDGVVIDGWGDFDTSYITGESKNKTLRENGEIISGYKMTQGCLHYKCTKTFEKSTLNKIIQALQNTKKSKLELLIDKISSYFAFFILFCFVACFIFWLNKTSFNLALINAVSVLVIACPCALALATPVCTLVASYVGFSKKILFKDMAMIEKLSRINMIAFDKTGILTKLKITKTIGLENEKNISILYALCSCSSHIISEEICKYLEKNYEIDKKTLPKINDFYQDKSKGIKAKIDDDEIIGGSYYYMQELGIKCFKKPTNTHFYLAINGKCEIFLEFDNIICDDAKMLFKNLEKLKIKSIILSGDNKTAVGKIASKLSVLNYFYLKNPLQKAEIIKKYAKTNKIAMVGDGVNDIIALKSAHIGVGIKGGSAAAIDCSDIILLDSKLSTFLNAIVLSKHCFVKIKQNLFFSFIYNIFGITLAFFGLVNPLLASILMSFSSIIVVLNATSLKFYK